MLMPLSFAAANVFGLQWDHNADDGKRREMSNGVRTRIVRLRRRIYGWITGNAVSSARSSPHRER